MKPERSVLMTAYHYPPEGSSSGVLRTLKFSRYLPAYGWSPHILTLRAKLYPVRDETLMTDIPPEATVHRVRAWDAARHFAIRGRYLECMAVPDSYISWLPFGVARGLRVIATHPVSAIFSTSPRPTAHLIAAGLKARSGLPWVADFRDPWIEPGVYPSPGTLRLRVEAALEAYVLRHADRITVTTPELREDLRRRFPDLAPEKFLVIYNGYDEADFEHLGPVPPPARFEILHAGLVTEDYRNPTPFLRAVSALIDSGELLRSEVEIVFLGGGHYVEGEAFRTVVRDLRLTEVVQVQSRIPLRQTLRRLQRAAVLLLLQGDEAESLIPAKTFEYLRIGRPILAVAVEGATPRLLRDLGAGVIVDSSSPERIARALQSLYHGWRRDPARRNRVAGIERFTRAALTAELATVLDDLVGATCHASQPR